MDREAKKNLLLKMNGLRASCHMSWRDIADVYEAEAGEYIEPGRLREQVGACVYRNRKRMLKEAAMELEKLNIKDDATVFTSIVLAQSQSARKSWLGRLADWLKSLFTGGEAKKVSLSWVYGGKNGSNAEEDTSASGWKLTKFTFDGKTVKFDGTGSMWGYTHSNPKARNCLFFKDGDKYVGGFFEWGDPSRKSRDIKNITGKYKGWDPGKLAKASEFAFCMTDEACRKRSNVLTFKR